MCLWTVLASKRKELALFDQLVNKRAEISAHIGYFLNFDEKKRSYGVKHGKILPKNRFFQHGCDTPQKKSVDRN